VNNSIALILIFSAVYIDVLSENLSSVTVKDHRKDTYWCRDPSSCYPISYG